MLFTDIEIVKNFKSDTLILNTYWSTLVHDDRWTPILRM